MFKLIAILGITVGSIYYFIIHTTYELATSKVAEIEAVFKMAGLE